MKLKFCSKNNKSIRGGYCTLRNYLGRIIRDVGTGKVGLEIRRVLERYGGKEEIQRWWWEELKKSWMCRWNKVRWWGVEVKLQLNGFEVCRQHIEVFVCLIPGLRQWLFPCIKVKRKKYCKNLRNKSSLHSWKGIKYDSGCVRWISDPLGSEGQSEFRKRGRSVNQMFVLRQVVEKIHGKKVYAVFIYLEKAL